MLWCLTLVSAIVGGIGYFVSKDDVIAASALAVVGILGLVGYRIRVSGFVAIATGLVVGGIYAPRFGPAIMPTVSDVLHTSPEVSQLASVSLAGMFLTLLTSAFMRSISRMLFRRDSFLEHSDSMGGFLFGSAQGVVAAVALIGGLLALEPVASRQLAEHSVLTSFGNSRNALQGMVMLAQRARTSAAYPLVERIDPFEWVPKLKQIKQTLRDPGCDDLTEFLARVSSAGPVATMDGQQAAEHESSFSNNSLGLHSAMSSRWRNTAEPSVLSHPAVTQLYDDPSVRRQLIQLLESYGSSRH